MFTDEEPATDVNNRPKLRYSIRKNGMWFVPRIIEDDGTADLEPFVMDDYENVYFSWTDSSKVFDDNTTDEEKAAAMRISFGVLNYKTNKINIETVPYLSKRSNVSEYSSMIKKIGDKIVLSWLVYNDITDTNNRRYGIEAFYYDPDTRSFYTDTNEVDRVMEIYFP